MNRYAKSLEATLLSPKVPFDQMPFALRIVLVDTLLPLPNEAAVYFSGGDIVYVHAASNMQTMQEELRRIVFDVFIDEQQYTE